VTPQVITFSPFI